MTVSLGAVLSVICGMPVTVTGSLKLTVTAMTVPALYEPFAVVVVAELTVGAVVSIFSVLLFCSELPPFTPGRVRVALFVPASWIVPPFKASEAVFT